MGAEILTISFSPPELLRLFQEELRLPFSCLSDVPREVYGAYGMKRGPLGRMVHWRVVLAYLRLLLRGWRLVRPQGDTLQLGGDVVIGRDGRVAYLYRSQGPEDAPKVSDVLQKLARC